MCLLPHCDDAKPSLKETSAELSLCPEQQAGGREAGSAEGINKWFPSLTFWQFQCIFSSLWVPGAPSYFQQPKKCQNLARPPMVPEEEGEMNWLWLESSGPERGQKVGRLPLGDPDRRTDSQSGTHPLLWRNPCSIQPSLGLSDPPKHLSQLHLCALPDN